MAGFFSSEKRIKKEIEDMESDLEIMKTMEDIPDVNRENALFCQRQVIAALKWTLENE